MIANVPRPASERTLGGNGMSGSVGSLNQALQIEGRQSNPLDSGVAVFLIACAHLIGLWALLQMDAVRNAVREAAPTLVEFILTETPPRPKPPPPAQTPVPIKPQQRTVIAVETPPTATTPAFAVPVTPHEPVAVPDAAAVDTRPAPPVPPAPPPPAAPKVLPMTAVAYAVPPPIEVPLASRRLREAGTVWLRVRVGRDGSPQQISLQRSSGFARLDQQAQEAMRLARFKPQTENGQPIEWIVTAPLQYDIE